MFAIWLDCSWAIFKRRMLHATADVTCPCSGSVHSSQQGVSLCDSPAAHEKWTFTSSVTQLQIHVSGATAAQSLEGASSHWKGQTVTGSSFIVNRPAFSVIGKLSVSCLTLIIICFSLLLRQLCAKICWGGYKSSGATWLLGSQSQLAYSGVSVSVCSRQ